MFDNLRRVLLLESLLLIFYLIASDNLSSNSILYQWSLILRWFYLCRSKTNVRFLFVLVYSADDAIIDLVISAFQTMASTLTVIQYCACSYFIAKQRWVECTIYLYLTVGGWSRRYAIYFFMVWRYLSKRVSTYSVGELYREGHSNLLY